MLSSTWKAAGSPKQVFGIATNVAGWNAFSKSPGEFAGTSDAKYNKCQDEKTYVNTFCPYVTKGGMPCHAIVDTGRNAVTGLRLEWGDWCNVNGAGFGVRPTSSTGDSLTDAFVWIKPGGESDGTSDTTATRYDSFCGHADGMLTCRFQFMNLCANMTFSFQTFSRSRTMAPGILRDAPQERRPIILNAYRIFVQRGDRMSRLLNQKPLILGRFTA